MNATIIENWNSHVKREDTVYLLGDLGMFRKKETDKITAFVRNLNGHKHFIYGNHDHKHIRKSEGWATKDYYKRANIDGQIIIMSHYPFMTWDRAHHGSWMLHGHCHGNLITDHPQPRLDVGVDVHDYRPIHLDEVREFMATRPYTIVDHHAERV